MFCWTLLWAVFCSRVAGRFFSLYVKLCKLTCAQWGIEEVAVLCILMRLCRHTGIRATRHCTVAVSLPGSPAGASILEAGPPHIFGHVLQCSQCSQDECLNHIIYKLRYNMRHSTQKFYRLLATLSFYQKCSVRLKCANVFVTTLLWLCSSDDRSGSAIILLSVVVGSVFAENNHSVSL